jgi:deazaflavin-dependent oxidoreductase (nitroreductase family)
MQYLYLTTTGRRTGLPREIEIWFAERDGRYYLIAERGERAGWVCNIRQDPRVTFRVGASVYTGAARPLDPSIDAERWDEARALFEGKYGWSDGLVVELTPDRDASG